MLSTAQFSELASGLDEPDAGFSVKASTGRSAPAGGFMVSRPGTEHRIQGHVTAAHLVDYANAHSAALGRPGHYMGAWRDPSPPGTADLDISRRYTNRDRATAAMFAGNQDALFDLHTFRSVRNYAKHGTKGSTLEGIIPDEGDPDYEALQHASRQKLHGRRGNAGEIFSR